MGPGSKMAAGVGALVALLTSFPSMAYTPSADIAARFPVTVQTRPNQTELAFREQIGTNRELAKEYLASRDWVKTTGWNEGSSDLCFDMAGSTVEINMCGSRHISYVQGTVVDYYQTLKASVRSSKYFYTHGDEILLVKYLQNAVMARSKITEDLCEADTIGWWGGTGRTSAILGCWSKSTSDISDFKLLGNLALMTDEALKIAPDDEQLFDPSTPAATVAKKRLNLIAKSQEQDGGDFEETLLREADQRLNEQYQKTRKRYEESYDEEWEGKKLSEYAIKVLTSQERAWIRYRDAFCQAYSVFLFPNEAEHQQYGSLARVECLAARTEEQTRVLAALDAE
ncbi:MAG: lysozyme inhibitor LprI family protein [Bdellovibrionales bacterium]